MFTFMKTIPPYWEPLRQMFYEMVGDPVKDSLMLAEVSPVFLVDRILCPLFVAQGANDPRVNINESNQVVDSLQKMGVEVEYMVKDNEGHGFYNKENQFELMTDNSCAEVLNSQKLSANKIRESRVPSVSL